MKITRREALKMGLAGGVFLSSWGVTDRAWAKDCSREPLAASTQTPQFSPQIPRFQQPLRIPEVLQPVRREVFKVTRRGQTVDRQIDYYEITMQKQKVNLLPLKQADGTPMMTEIWGYNGSALGPIIRQPKREESCIRFINQLGKDKDNQDICTSVHLHGMASLPQYDGYAEDLTLPGGYKDYYYPNNRGATLWYHDHAVHKTSRNVYMGLAGMYIVEYGKEDFCNPDDFDCLPSGEYEVPLIIQDKSFDKNGNLVFNDRLRRGVYSDVILVNGTPYPYLAVQRRKYRFRVLNASASRTYQLALSRDEKTFPNSADRRDKLIVVASDAGLLSQPAELVAPNQPLRMGIGERYEVVIDFSQYGPDVKHVYLRNLGFASNLGTEAPALMRFDLSDQPVSDPSYVPAKLGKVTLQSALESRRARTRTFRFGRGGDWMINGKTWSKDRVDANPGLCDVEVWELINTGGWAHPVHVHLVDFQVLDRNGAAPPAYERGWKDVVLLNDSDRVRVIARFGPNPGKYMMHCHNLVHEDHDMMTQFEVIGPGAQDPMSDPPKLLPAPPIGSIPPPPIVDIELPAKCFEEFPNQCSM